MEGRREGRKKGGRGGRERERERGERNIDNTFKRLKSTHTFKEVLCIVLHLAIRQLLTHHGLECLLQRLPPKLGVHIELGEVPGLCGPAVPVSECPQTLQTLGHDAGKPLLPSQG